MSPAAGEERPAAPGTERGAALTELARAAYSLSAADARLRGRATRHQGALSLTHARALRVLAEQGPLSVRQLAGRTETTSAGATQLVSGLVKAGYVVKEPDPDNRRAVIVSLTPEGRGRHEERERGLTAALASAFAHLDDGELVVASDTLRRLGAIYDDL